MRSRVNSPNRNHYDAGRAAGRQTDDPPTCIIVFFSLARGGGEPRHEPHKPWATGLSSGSNVPD